ncbi:MAG: hypothetical protein WBD07_01600 [Vicinamibacterales bacterium]
MRTTKRIAMSALALLTMLGVGSTASAQQVQLAMRNGRVSLVAKDATVRQILAEWARIGQTKVVNLERIPGGPITIELTNVSEDEALDVLLRSVSGYMTAPRPTPVAGLSWYDRIVVMPTSATPPRAAPAASTASRPLLPPPVVDDSDGDQPPPASQAVPPRGPVFTNFPQPQILNPQQAAPGAGPANPLFPQPQILNPQQQAVPGAPSPVISAPTASGGGVSVPGMIVPPPQQPGTQTPQR